MDLVVKDKANHNNIIFNQFSRLPKETIVDDWKSQGNLFSKGGLILTVNPEKMTTNSNFKFADLK